MMLVAGVTPQIASASGTSHEEGPSIEFLWRQLEAADSSAELWFETNANQEAELVQICRERLARACGNEALDRACRKSGIDPVADSKPDEGVRRSRELIKQRIWACGDVSDKGFHSTGTNRTLQGWGCDGAPRDC